MERNDIYNIKFFTGLISWIVIFVLHWNKLSCGKVGEEEVVGIDTYSDLRNALSSELMGEGWGVLNAQVAWTVICVSTDC